jgi:ubiquitin C-terminal hydrolase
MRPVALTALVEAVLSTKPVVAHRPMPFTRGAMGDAHELFLRLISAPGKPTDTEGQRRAALEVGRNCCIKLAVTGTVREVLKCEVCNDSRSGPRLDSSDVNLPVFSDDNGRVYASVSAALESLSVPMEARCEACGGDTQHTKTERYDDFPRVLVAHVLRFSNVGAVTHKTRRPMAFDVRLDMRRFGTAAAAGGAGGGGGARGVYDLAGVVMHEGPTQATGPYLAYVRVPVADGPARWAEMSDASCREVTEAEMLQLTKSGAYLLFYAAA